VFVASHAAGDDRYTGALARKLAEQTGGSYIVNKNFIKSTNSRADTCPERVADFNRNSWSHAYKKYSWKRDKPEKRIFYEDIAEIYDTAKLRRGQKAVAIHIHGMKHEELAADLGIGLRTNTQTGELETNTDGHVYTGRITMPVSFARDLQIGLHSVLSTEERYPVHEIGIGRLYPAFSKRMGVPFHKHNGRSDYAVQVEINRRIKEKKRDRDAFTTTFAKQLHQVFR